MSQAPDIAAGRLPAERYAAELRRPAPAAQPARGPRRRRALPVLLRRALRPGLPDLDRHPAVHPPDRHRQPAGLGQDHPRFEHHGRHVRPGLPDRDPVRGGLRPRDRRGQAGRDRPPAALRHRCAVRHRPPALPPGRRHRAQGGRGRRRPRRPRLRPQARHARPRGDPVRGPGQARRPQRVRHRRLQDRGRLRASARSTGSWASAGSSCAAGVRLGRDVDPGRPAPRLRRRVPGPGPGCRERAGHRRGRARRRHGRRRLHRGPAPGIGSRRPCRSAATSWSSAAA